MLFVLRRGGSFKGHYDSGHVITAYSFTCIPCEEEVEQFLNDDFVVFNIFEILFDDINESLTILYISLPYTITPDDDKLIATLSFHLPYVGLACDHLLIVP